MSESENPLERVSPEELYSWLDRIQAESVEQEAAAQEHTAELAAMEHTMIESLKDKGMEVSFFTKVFAQMPPHTPLEGVLNAIDIRLSELLDQDGVEATVEDLREREYEALVITATAETILAGRRIGSGLIKQRLQANILQGVQLKPASVEALYTTVDELLDGTSFQSLSQEEQEAIYVQLEEEKKHDADRIKMQRRVVRSLRNSLEEYLITDDFSIIVEKLAAIVIGHHTQVDEDSIIGRMEEVDQYLEELSLPYSLGSQRIVVAITRALESIRYL